MCDKEKLLRGGDCAGIPPAWIEATRRAEAAANAAEDALRERLKARIAARDAAEAKAPGPQRQQLTCEAWLSGDTIVLLGRPAELPIPEGHHNCDAMGCGSVGLHVLARIPVAELIALERHLDEHPPPAIQNAEYHRETLRQLTDTDSIGRVYLCTDLVIEGVLLEREPWLGLVADDGD